MVNMELLACSSIKKAGGENQNKRIRGMGMKPRRVASY
jgi:hypothetical protein